MNWQDAARRLELEPRTGRYPGMPERREFLVTLHDAGPAGRAQTRSVVYDGSPIVVEF